MVILKIPTRVSTKKIILPFVLLSILLFPITSKILAQESSSPLLHRIHSGYYSYGFDEHIFYQFSGKENYNDGATPSSFFLEALAENPDEGNGIYTGNLAYEIVFPISAKVEVPDFITGYSINFEWSKFQTNSLRVAGDKQKSNNIKMNQDLYSFGLRLYFATPGGTTVAGQTRISDFINLFIGTGWGWMNGSFEGKLTTADRFEFQNKSFRTKFEGPLTYRELGILFFIDDHWGASFILRPIRANLSETNNDPFDQDKTSDTLVLDFSGIITIINLTYEF